MKKVLFLFALLAVLVPAVSLAQGGFTGANPQGCAAVTTITDIQSFICKLNDILAAIIPFLVALGILYFIWGVISFVIADDEAAKEKGRNRIVWGIIGLVVIIGVWALVRFVTTTFGLNNVQRIQYPTVPY